MKASLYDKIAAEISSYKKEDCLQHLIDTFPEVEHTQLQCIMGQEVQKRVKRSYQHYTQPSVVNRLYKKYCSAVENGEAPGILIRMALHYSFSPAMLSKILLEKFLDLQEQRDEFFSDLTELREEANAEVGEAVPDTNNDRINSLPETPPSQTTEQPILATPITKKVQEFLGAGDEASLSNNPSASTPSATLPIPEPNLSFDDSELVIMRDINLTLPETPLLNNRVSSFTTPGDKDKIDTSLTKNGARSRINKFFRDTSLIPDKRLSLEVHLSLIEDNVYGPFSDTIKHSIGHEYEVMLCRKLKERGVFFKTEDDLRSLGCDKTPDIKLDVPIGVDGKVVNWIESKALFGDRESHKTYLKDQLWSYWNRFGPGLVIYWFGYIDELDTLCDKGIMIRDTFPTDIVFLDPLCEQSAGRDLCL